MKLQVTSFKSFLPDNFADKTSFLLITISGVRFRQNELPDFLHEQK